MGYVFLDNKLNNVPVTENVESVPFYTQIPDNKTILFEFCNDKWLVNLDFSEKCINLFFGEDSVETGYEPDYFLQTDYETVGYFIDNIGGIEIAENDKLMRYTGVQIAEMLTYKNISEETKKSIANEIIKGYADNDFTKENLLYLIENTKTNLKFNEGFLWIENIREICKLPRFIN